MDPEQLARAHLRPEDQAIKDRDVPERLQETLGPDGGAGDVANGKIDLDVAADWIYRWGEGGWAGAGVWAGPSGGSTQVLGPGGGGGGGSVADWLYAWESVRPSGCIGEGGWSGRDTRRERMEGVQRVVRVDRLAPG